MAGTTKKCFESKWFFFSSENGGCSRCAWLLHSAAHRNQMQCIIYNIIMHTWIKTRPVWYYVLCTSTFIHHVDRKTCAAATDRKRTGNDASADRVFGKWKRACGCECTRSLLNTWPSMCACVCVCVCVCAVCVCTRVCAVEKKPIVCESSSDEWVGQGICETANVVIYLQCAGKKPTIMTVISY